MFRYLMGLQLVLTYNQLNKGVEGFAVRERTPQHAKSYPSFLLASCLVSDDRNNKVIVTVDETYARSVFGTKEYWDDVYLGRGDFPADCYSWYFGWEVLGRILQRYVPLTAKGKNGGKSIVCDTRTNMIDNKNKNNNSPRILVPGIGNDSILLDLYKAGYRNLVGQDYSEHAVERQYDLLSYEGIQCSLGEDENDEDQAQSNINNNNNAVMSVQIMQGDVTNLPDLWTNSFDVILEKGLLDAVYLSGDGNFEAAVKNLDRVLRPGGIFISVSGVVPHELRKHVFPTACVIVGNGSVTDYNSEENYPRSNLCTNTLWEWLVDGSSDLKAGCFVLQKKSKVEEH